MYNNIITNNAKQKRLSKGEENKKIKETPRHPKIQQKLYIIFYSEPAARNAPTTEQKKKIVTNNSKITKTINKNIEKTMMERAQTGKEKLKFLKV